MLNKKLDKLKKFVPKNSKLGKAMAVKDKLTGKDKKDKKEEQKKKKGSGGTPSTMSIAKVVFGSGIAIGGAVIIGCIVMTAVTMFSTVTGTSVQIIDGSIIQYGEPTPGPEKDKKKGVGSGEYSGDELYIKLKMIVEAVEADNSLKKKVDKVKVPDSVPHDLRSGSNGIGMNTKRGGIYHLLQVGYIMKEISMNEWTSKLEDAKGNKLSYDWRGLLGMFYQENSCGSSYENDFPSDSDGGWLSAFKLSTLGSDGTPGAFQTQKAYFGDGQRSFITSIENPSAGTYGKVGKPKDVKDLMKKCVNSRIKAGSSQDSVNDTSCYFFADSVASSINGVIWDNAYCPNEHFKQTVGNKDYPKESDNILAMLYLAWGHRGGAFYQSNHRWYTGDLVHMLAEAAVDGLLVEDELMKYLDKVPTGIGYTEFAKEITKSGGLIDAIMKDDKLGMHQDYKALTLKTGDGYVDGGSGNLVPGDIYKDPFFRLCVCLHGGQEIEALANAAFDELGLTLPTSGGGKMELKETKGEFQGFWSDKNGKTLSSDEMKAYSSAGDFSNQKKSAVVGLKETISLGGTFDNDTFKGKFGDDVGVIWYKQATANENWGGFRDNPHAVDGLGSYFCGGYAVSIVLSTMLHRYINPAEIIYATNTYDERHGGSSESSFWSGDSGGMFLVETQKKCYEEQMYKGKKLFKVEGPTSLSKEKVNSTLDNGGLVTGSFKHPIAAGSGHFVTIRSKDNNGNYYLADPACNSTRRNDPENKLNHKFSWSSLSNLSKSQVLYINPGPGYQDYLNDYMTSQSESSGGSGGSGRYLGEEIVEYAMTFVGKLAYNHGLSLTTGTDCSGFVKLIYGHFNIETDMPRASYDQYDHWIKKGTKKVPFELNKLKPGDLLYYKNGSNIGHVAMYAGNGKVVHESSKKTGCKTSDWNYRRPAGVFRIIDDNVVSSSGGNANLGGGWSGNTMSNKNFPYWKQTGTPIGSGKNQCPHSIKSSCGVYSEIKILKAFGINKSFDALYNAGNGIIRVRGTVLVLPQGVPTLAAKYGVSLNYDQDNSKYDLTKPLIMKKVAGDIQKILKKGGYCMMEIDYDGTRGNSGGAGGGDHFVVVSASNGEQLKIWDSGHVSNTNASHSTWFNYYKNSATANRLYVTRLSYYWPK